jgi:DeoR family suf operon transcriptional repressor
MDHLSYATPAKEIVSYLQRHGQATIKDLEAALGVTATAVREQLIHLQGDGLVAAAIERRGPGRPHHIYTLTPKAQRLFPKNYDLLITLLLRQIIAETGSQGLGQILEQVSTRMAQQYELYITGHELGQRLEELCDALEQQGIPAAVAPTGDGLSVFSCPYFEVAQEHPAVCTMERQMIERLLGEKIVLQHSIREGHHNCKFVVDTIETLEG